MKILLINPLIQPSLWEDDLIANWPPLGLAYIAAALEQHNHSVKILERKRIAATTGRLKYTDENLKEIDIITKKEVKKFSPDYVGITATTPLIMDGFRTARLIKDISDIPVVFGGYHPSFDPTRTLEDCEAIDIVVRGEGEMTMSEIVGGKNLEEIDGIAFRANGKVITTKMRKAIEKLDILPFPARHLLDTDYYFAPSAGLIRGYWVKGTSVFTARGCPFECTYCQSPQYRRSNYGKAFRIHSPEYVIDEIKYLISNYGLEAILFAEDIFNINCRRAEQICHLLIETGLFKKIIWAANSRVNLVDKEMLQLMNKAGCVHVIYGIESGSQRTLDNIKKKATVKEAYNAIRWTKEAGMSCEANIMIGLPGEREEDFLETIEFLNRAKPDMINRGKLFPIPGTEIYYDLKAKGIVKDHSNWNDILDYYTRGDFTFADMPIDKFNKLKAKLDREIVLSTNYMFRVKTNLRKDPIFALEQFLLMLVHIMALYFPMKIQKLLRKVSEFLRIKSRLVFKIGAKKHVVETAE